LARTGGNACINKQTSDPVSAASPQGSSVAGFNCGWVPFCALLTILFAALERLVVSKLQETNGGTDGANKSLTVVIRQCRKLAFVSPFFEG